MTGGILSASVARWVLATASVSFSWGGGFLSASAPKAGEARRLASTNRTAQRRAMAHCSLYSKLNGMKKLSPRLMLTRFWMTERVPSGLSA